MHGDLARRWKVEDLALAVGMSRTTFTQRFKTLVGLPPLDYLMRWRMTVAGTELRKGDKSLSAVAESVGYASDTAFNSAFKRTIGQSPGRWRSGN
ncbi:helix-turn-helix transcriptional regulator [Pararhizobium sp. LjRoot238]|uniref:helix-turn-helix transcriptional regulator n=1 Tax=Pararhizobium sp. LjRoot238 TaxID=3342293 RepID=UPI003ECC394B